MAGDEDVTLGELGRRFDRFETNINAAIQRFSADFVTAAVWQAEKRLIEEARASMGREIAELKASQKAAAETKHLEHEKIRAEIKAERNRADGFAEANRRFRAQVFLSLGVGLLGIIGSAVVGVALAIFTNTIGGAP